MARVFEFERPGCEDPRKSVSHRGKIHSACARRADLRRSGRGRELLPARRALFPPDRGGAGAVPAEQSALLPSRKRHAAARATTASTTATTTGSRRMGGGGEVSLTARASRSPICRATRSRSRSTSSSQQPAAAAPAAAAASRARKRRRRRPAAVLHHRRAAAAASGAPAEPQGQNGHDNQPDRFPLHRRRRRHRGPRPDVQGGGDGGDDSAPRDGRAMCAAIE